MPVDNRRVRSDGDLSGTGADRRLELYVRDDYPPALTATIETVLDRCSRLETADVVDEYRLEQWPQRAAAVGGASTGERTSRRELVAAFEEWAREHGYSLEPAFRRRTISASLRDRDVRYEHVSVPLMALALYEDGDLSGVAPCSDDERTYTVERCLTALEAREYESFPRSMIRGDRGATIGEEGDE